MNKINKTDTILLTILIIVFILTIAVNYYTNQAQSTIQSIIEALTLLILFGYALSTEKIKDQAVKQNEISQMPIMALYIRDIREFKSAESRQKIKDNGYLIKLRQSGDTNYVLRLRNMGQGPAFNVEIVGDMLSANKYETNFFAPLNDEHSVSLIRKPDKKPENFNDLNGENINIYCHSASGIKYLFKYKIIDVETKKVEYIETRDNFI